MDTNTHSALYRVMDGVYAINESTLRTMHTLRLIYDLEYLNSQSSSKSFIGIALASLAAVPTCFALLPDDERGAWPIVFGVVAVSALIRAVLDFSAARRRKLVLASYKPEFTHRKEQSLAEVLACEVRAISNRVAMLCDALQSCSGGGARPTASSLLWRQKLIGHRQECLERLDELREELNTDRLKEVLPPDQFNKNRRVDRGDSRLDRSIRCLAVIREDANVAFRFEPGRRR